MDFMDAIDEKLRLIAGESSKTDDENKKRKLEIQKRYWEQAKEQAHIFLGITKGSRNKILEPNFYKGKVII